jgi:hypothetical protein
MSDGKVRIAVEVLNGATGEVREVVARVAAAGEQDAVNALFARGRKDDYCYRFLGRAGVIAPVSDHAVAVQWQNQTYWSLEG